MNEIFYPQIFEKPFTQTRGHEGAESCLAAEMRGNHSFEHTRSFGFKGMPFNLIVSTNEAAAALCEKIGFMDAHIVYQEL